MDKDKMPRIKYSDEEVQYIGAMISDITRMRDQREQKFVEFDGLTYTERYEANRQADLNYNDRTGDADQRDKAFNLTTGATRNKDTAVLSHALSFNFDAEIEVRDEDNHKYDDFAEALEYLVECSRDDEEWKNKRIGIYRELIAQGHVYAHEQVIERMVSEVPQTDWNPRTMKLSEYSPDKFSANIIKTEIGVRLVLGKYVFLSDLKEADIRNQARVVLYDEVSYEDFKRVYGEWERFEYVVPNKEGATALSDTAFIKTSQGNNETPNQYGADYFWNLLTVGKGNVGLLYVYDQFANRVQILANGIPMLPMNFALSHLSPTGYVPLVKGDAEVIQGFAYPKGIPANTYVDNRMYDFVVQAMVKKMMQSAEPTLTNNTGVELPRNWLVAGRMYAGIKPRMIEPLLPQEARSINDTDVKMFDVVKEILDSKSVSDTFTGADPSMQTNSATEFMEQKKNAIKKLFQIILGIEKFERQLAELRIGSILTQYPKSKDKKSRAGTRSKVNKDIHIHFYDEKDTIPTLMDLWKKENALQLQSGRDTKIMYMHSPSVMQLMRWKFKITVKPEESEPSAMEVQAYLDTKMAIANIMTPNVLNIPEVLKKVAKMQKENPDKMYHMDFALPDPNAQTMASASAPSQGQAPSNSSTLVRDTINGSKSNRTKR